MQSTLEDIMDIMNQENFHNATMVKFREKSENDEFEVFDEDMLVKKIWNQSVDFNQFKEEMLKLEYYDFENWEERNIFGQLSEKTDNHRDRLLNFFGDRCFDVNSKKGRLIIRNSKKYTDWIKCNEIPSYHNGKIKVAVFEKGEIDDDYFFDMMRGLSGTGFLKGKTDICDCNENIIKSIEGNYMAFLYQDIVAFVGS